jgi:hypothetical protein
VTWTIAPIATPTALAPLDLDTCEIDDGDDITGILTGLASTYGDVYVRAPSRTANGCMRPIPCSRWTISTFYEDESAANTLTQSFADSARQQLNMPGLPGRPDIVVQLARPAIRSLSGSRIGMSAGLEPHTRRVFGRKSAVKLS